MVVREWAGGERTKRREISFERTKSLAGRSNTKCDEMGP
jgi:hypothetical protein